MTETSMDAVENEVDRLKPRFLIIDSIQTMMNRELNNAAGSVTQIREATTALTRIAKQNGCAIFIIGHVTKEGALAGPRMLEHMVDTVLYFEGDRHDSLRLLRAVKNRFGSTNEIGIFEMCRDGMKEVENPAGLFVSGGNDIGCAVTCIMEGNRPILVEIQSLLSTSAFANARRTAFDEPFMLVRSMVYNEVHHDLNSSFVSCCEHAVEVFHGSEFVHDCLIITDIISVVIIW